MNLLFITTQFPYPMDNGGKIGAFNGISVASRDYDVTVLSFTEEPQFINEGLLHFKKVFPNVKFVKPIVHDIHIRKKPLKLMSAILSGYIKKTPYIASKFYNVKMYNKIHEIFSNNAYWDFIFIDYLNMQIYGDYIQKNYNEQYGHFIFKDHNLEFEIVKQEASSSSGLKKLILELEWKRTLRYEIKAIKNAELNFSVCESNTEFLKKYNINSYTMLPTYEMLPERRDIPKNNSILYMGNLSWKSNLDGLCWFVDKVFPIIRNTVPDVELKVVGSGPNDNIFSNCPGVKYLGYIKDISHIYDDEKVFIVPLFEGSGIRIKILEAFNNEISVVSTHLGCNTIGARNGKELFIADSIKDFSSAVITLLKDDKLNNSIRKNGKNFLEEKFSLKNRQDEFRTIMSNSFKE